MFQQFNLILYLIIVLITDYLHTFTELQTYRRFVVVVVMVVVLFLQTAER